MNSSFILLSVLALSFSSLSHGKVTMIPKALEDIKLIESGKTKNHSRLKLRLQIKNTPNDISTPSNWFNLSPSQGAEGVSSDLTYGMFGIPQGEEVVVAVIDSGVDVNHEDLQGKIWVNKNEIANDGIDNDNNGYIDDIFGWNFIGAKDGMAKIIADPSNLNQLTH